MSTKKKPETMDEKLAALEKGVAALRDANNIVRLDDKLVATVLLRYADALMAGQPLAVTA